MSINVTFIVGGVQHGIPVDVAALDALETCVSRPENCIQEYRNVFAEVMADNALQMPRNLSDASHLYASIMDAIYG